MLDNCVVILGSGLSINDLTAQERKLINSCPVKIAINKYSAFYELAGIEPTHVFFTDDYYESSILFFQYLVQKLKKNNLRNLTFIVSKDTAKFLIRNSLEQLLIYIRIGLIRIRESIFFKYAFNRNYQKNKDKWKEKKGEGRFKYLGLPVNSKIHSVEIKSWTIRNTPWATSLDMPLYHYKGSISSVLNYISIFFENKKIILVGVDFNSSDYFFEKQLNQLEFDTKDWTYGIRKEQNKHYSIIEIDGNKIDDELPFMINELAKKKNVMFSLNKQSYLVEKGFVESISIDDLIQQDHDG